MSGSYRTGSSGFIEVEERLSAGAAGAAFTVRGRADAIVKLLDHPSAEDEQRIKAMLSIDVPRRVPGAAAVIAWPTDLVFDQKGNYVGFLMPRAPNPDPVTLGTLALRRERETRLSKNLGWDALLRIITNYSAAVAALHASSVVVCDINLKNAMVSGDLTVTVIDCDSTQVEVGGHVYLSNYFQDEFLAPELKGAGGLKGKRRLETSDRWSLAVLIWLTLMDGHHPFDGRWLGSGEPDRDDHIRVGRFPHDPGSGELKPSREAPPWRALPPNLQQLFLETFTTGARDPSRRPAALAWAEALRAAGAGLRQCNGASGRFHWFPASESDCPWCEYENYLLAGSPKAQARKSAPSPRVQQPTAPRPGPQARRAAPVRPVPKPRPSPPPPPSPRRSGVGRTVAFATLALFLVGIVVAIAQGGESGGGGSGGSGASSTVVPNEPDESNRLAAQRAARAPARAIRLHYLALGNGAYRRAFGFMAPAYRHEHHLWLEQVRESRPSINLISVGRPRIHRGVAWVPVLFFARDTYDTARSDTVCRRFDGKVHMVKTYEGWRYDPTEDFEVTEKPNGAARCP